MASTIVPTTLNPLPDSVLISSARFTASLVAVITPDETLNTSPVWFGASGDLTGDGFPEVVLTGWGSYSGPASPAQPVYLLSTNPAGTTVIDTADYLGLGSITGTSAPRIADLDNNGLGDFFFLPYGENPFDPQTPYVVQQVAPGEFDIVAIAGPDMISHSSTEGDFNGDGFLDLIAVGARMDMGYFPGAFFESAALLYLGDGQGGFMPYAMAFDQPAGDVRTGDVQFLGGSSAAFADFDNDGDTEIVFSDAASFQNGIPTDGPLRGDILLVSDIQFGEREAWGNVRTIAIPYFDAHPEYEEYDSFLGDQKSHDIKTVTLDVDNDGLLDILVCGLIWSPEGRNLGGVLQVLRNKGNLEFEDITDTSLCNFFLGKSAGHELRLVDVNADGFVDIYMPEIGNEIYSGENPGTEYQTWANQLLINTGEGRFVQAMWNEFNELGQLESALLEPPLGMGPARNWKFNLYVLPDGRIGFIKHEHAGSEDGTVLALFDFRADEVLSTGPGGSDPALQGAPGFSEYFYLTHYPAVAAAVEGGAYENGLEHYLEVGRTQGLFAFAPNAILHGAGGDDLIEAREGNETIIASSGNDTVDGGAGFDVMRFQGALGDFDHEGGLDGLRISGGSIDSLLEGIERVQFSDASIALDMDGAAGSVVRILGVVFGAAAASQPAWVGIGLSLADAGMSESTLMALALEVGLGAGASNAQVVSLLYQNLAGEAPTQDIVDFFSGEIEQGTYTQVSLALLAASLPLNLQLIGMGEMEVEGVVYVPY